VTTPGGDDGSRRWTTEQAIAELLDEHTRLLDELQAGRQEDAARFRQLQETVEGLVAQTQRQRAYEPVAPPRWWELDGAAREEAVDYLHEWVDQVYRTSYEQYAEDLGPCWDQHPLCLFLLDWLSEWHKFLYLRETRPSSVLPAMAEWHTRFLPAAAEIMRDVTRSCEHRADIALGEESLLAPARANGRRGGRNGHRP
jgi:hypothetical protein